MNLKAKDTFYVGVNDHKTDLFEGIYKVPNGVSYNSYVIMDEKIAVMDAVDEEFGDIWIENLKKVLGDRQPDYIVVQHMEPDHSANTLRFIKQFPGAKIVGNNKTFVMLAEYFGTDFSDCREVVGDGSVLSLGRHELRFIFAPMVHWPEVMVTYDTYTKSVFSADGFGKFGALDVDEPWEDEARRYYYGIVGKYGKQVDAALKKLSALEIEAIYPLHGPSLEENLQHYLNLYSAWATYQPECNGVMIAFSSVYGHTAKAVELLKKCLEEEGVRDVLVHDLIRDDRSVCIADAFRYPEIVLATTTYNADIFPAMREFIDCLTERNYQNRTIAFIENGTWAPVAAKLMQAKFEKCANISYAQTAVKIRSALSAESEIAIKNLAKELGANKDVQA